MRRNKKLLFGGISIITGGMLMRFAWAIINEQLSVFLILAGSVLFLGGVIYFANSLFKNK